MKTAGLILISAFVLFFLLGQLSLIDPDEGRYAESAREMITSNQYLIPLLNSNPRINKPILFYWTILASYKVFGINEFAARFPSALSGLALILGLHFFIRRERKGNSFIPALILLSSPIFLISSRIAITDMLFTTLVVFAIFSFWLSLNDKKFIYPFFMFAGLSLATKGPVGVILILFSVVIFAIIEKDLFYIKRFFNIRGILLMLLIGGSWYLMLFLKIGSMEFIELIRQETLGRFRDGFVHREAFYYYIPIIVAGFLPWSLFFFKFKRSDLKVKLNRFLVIYIFIAFIFFSLCKSKLPTYILSIFPLLSIAISSGIERSWNKKTDIGLIFFAILIIVSLALRFIVPEIVYVGAKIPFKSISLVIFFIALPLLILSREKLKIQFFYLTLIPAFIYFYLLFSYGGAFSNYRSTENLFKNKDFEASTVYTWKFFKPSILFYSKAKVDEIDRIEDFKEGFLVIPKDCLVDLKTDIPDFKVISYTDKYILIKVQKLQE